MVYATTAVGIGIAAYGSHVHLTPSAAPAWLPATRGSDNMTIAQIVFAALLFVTGLKACRAPFVLRFALFAAVAFAAGLNVGTWVQKALQELGYCAGQGWSSIPNIDFLGRWLGRASVNTCSMTHPLVKTAFLYTTGIYASFSVAALVGSRNNRWLMYVGSLVLAGSWIMWGTYILARMGVVADKVFDAVYVKAGLVLYALKTWYDTYVMASEIESSDDPDVLNLALNQLLNFLQIFIRVVSLLADAKKKKEKE
jgi:hypothetical protein